MRFLCGCCSGPTDVLSHDGSEDIPPHLDNTTQSPKPPHAVHDEPISDDSVLNGNLSETDEGFFDLTEEATEEAQHVPESEETNEEPTADEQIHPAHEIPSDAENAISPESASYAPLGDKNVDDVQQRNHRVLGGMLKGVVVQKYTKYGNKHERFLWVPASTDRLNWAVPQNGNESMILKGSIPFAEITEIKGLSRGQCSLVVKSTLKNLTIRFSNSQERDDWCDGLRIAIFNNGFDHFEHSLNGELVTDSIERLKQGEYFVKNYKNQSSRRFFYLTSDLSRLCWTTEEKYKSDVRYKGSIPCDEIKEINTGVVKDGKYPFLIVKKNAKQLELICDDVNLRSLWIRDLKSLIRHGIRN